eukprot:CAMPEP_0167769488 /NCGR_PEP_ID=MMETSP0110_2-20121227/17329_1 /TAXON_ID=629695 /ORGANISM="Gymnochlora sp., Strain CCMP2014" /LENGTH=207 /DNA_ID=CAMNT_0007658435 /DNA_START=136 /DNA_END=759 /DNA_ORIENTATION=+
MKDLIAKEDEKIINFTKSLARHEQKLHDAALEEKRIVDIHGRQTKQSFKAHEVLVFSERLGQLSAQGYQETLGYSGFHRPPAPQQKEMGFSNLKLKLPDMLKTEFVSPPKPLADEKAKTSEPVDEKVIEETVKDEAKETTNMEIEPAFTTEDMKLESVKEVKEKEDTKEEAEERRATFDDFMLFTSTAGDDSDDSGDIVLSDDEDEL